MKSHNALLIFVLLAALTTCRSSDEGEGEYSDIILDKLLGAVPPISKFINDLFQKDVIDPDLLVDFIRQVYGPAKKFAKQIWTPIKTLIMGTIKQVTSGKE